MSDLLQSWVQAEDDRLREAITECRKLNVAESGIVAAVMVRLKGKANPRRVYELAQEVQNGP